MKFFKIAALVPITALVIAGCSIQPQANENQTNAGQQEQQNELEVLAQTQTGFGTLSVISTSPEKVEQLGAPSLLGNAEDYRLFFATEKCLVLLPKVPNALASENNSKVVGPSLALVGNFLL